MRFPSPSSPVKRDPPILRASRPGPTPALLDMRPLLHLRHHLPAVEIQQLRSDGSGRVAVERGKKLDGRVLNVIIIVMERFDMVVV